MAAGREKWKKRRGERLAFRGKCPWRKTVGKNPGARYGLRVALMMAFGLEAAVICNRAPSGERPGFGVVSSREEYKVEWVLPPRQPGALGGEAYGIRIRPREWELELYHSKERIRPEP